MGIAMRYLNLHSNCNCNSTWPGPGFGFGFGFGLIIVAHSYRNYSGRVVEWFNGWVVECLAFHESLLYISFIYG